MSDTLSSETIPKAEKVKARVDLSSHIRIPFSLKWLAYGLLVIYGFTISNYAAAALLVPCILGFLTNEKHSHVRVSTIFLITMCTLVLFSFSYAPSLERLLQGNSYFSLPLAWIGMLAAGFYLNTGVGDDLRPMTSVLWFVIPLASLLPFSVILTLQHYNIDSVLAVLTTNSRLLINPLTGDLSSGTGISTFAALGISLIGIVFLRSRSPKEVFLQILATGTALFSAITALLIGNRSSLLIIVVSIILALLYNLGVEKNKRRILIAITLIILIYTAYSLDILNIRTIVESSYLVQRITTTPFDTDGRWNRWSAGIEKIPIYYLAGGADFGAHNTFLDILLTGGIFPFFLFCVIEVAWLLTSIKIALLTDVSVIARHALTAMSVTLFILMIIEPTLNGSPLVMCTMFFLMGSMTAVLFNHIYR